MNNCNKFWKNNKNKILEKRHKKHVGNIYEVNCVIHNRFNCYAFYGEKRNTDNCSHLSLQFQL